MYRWTFRNGNVVELCAECCADWRRFGVEDNDPDLIPERIETLRP